MGPLGTLGSGRPGRRRVILLSTSSLAISEVLAAQGISSAERRRLSRLGASPTNQRSSRGSGGKNSQNHQVLPGHMTRFAERIHLGVGAASDPVAQCWPESERNPAVYRRSTTLLSHSGSGQHLRRLWHESCTLVSAADPEHRLRPSHTRRSPTLPPGKAQTARWPPPSCGHFLFLTSRAAGLGWKWWRRRRA